MIKMANLMLYIFHHNKMKIYSKKKEGNGKTFSGRKYGPLLTTNNCISEIGKLFLERNSLLYKEYSFDLNMVPNFWSIPGDV